MAKYFVVQGSVALPPETTNGVPEPRTAGLGDSIVLTEAQAKGLLETGFVVDEKTFAGMRKMIDGAAESGAALPKNLAKLAKGLAARRKE